MRLRTGKGLVLATALGIAVLAPADGRATPIAAVADESAGFAAFVAAFRAEADAHGISRATFDAAFAGVTPDPTVAAMTRRQPEFVKPLGAYLASQVTQGRVAAGRALRVRWRGDLARIEQRYGVPGPILLAIWGLETGYGAFPGSKDVIRSLATLAALDWRADLCRAELLAALTLLQSGEVPRERLRGSWAGAMGQPQFMPSSFAAYAVDGDGDGHKDIWTSVPDTLASIANFLAAHGWQTGHPWGFAVTFPNGLDLRISHGSGREWSARGLARIDGGALPAAEALTLFFPAGADGPAFLVTPNVEVLKVYNQSDAYVLSIAMLADRMAGAAPLALSWPNAPSMDRAARIELQSRLVDLGYPVDDRQGRISLAFRDTVRRAQSSVGAVPDGNPTDALLAALRTASPAR